MRLYRPSGGALPGAWSRKGRADLRVGPRRPPMRAALRRCRKGRMTGGDWREPVRTHVSLGTSMPKITGILKIYPPQRSAGGVWETRSKAEGFPHGTFQGAQRACGCGKPPNEMVWDGASSPGFSMAASRPLGWGRTCPLASVPNMPVRKVSIRRWMARMAEKEPIRVRMGSGISGLSLKVVNRWYGRRSACARGATPCGLAGFAPTFLIKDGAVSQLPLKDSRDTAKRRGYSISRASRFLGSRWKPVEIFKVCRSDVTRKVVREQRRRDAGQLGSG